MREKNALKDIYPVLRGDHPRTICLVVVKIIIIPRMLTRTILYTALNGEGLGSESIFFLVGAMHCAHRARTVRRMVLTASLKCPLRKGSTIYCSETARMVWRAYSNQRALPTLSHVPPRAPALGHCMRITD